MSHSFPTLRSSDLRVVPLDLFQTSIVGSALVQKTYSANYPGEFGGGVINLTTRALPDEPFLKIGVGVSGDTETTGKLGYTYYGGDLRSEEHTSELQSLMRISYAVFCLKKKTTRR